MKKYCVAIRLLAHTQPKLYRLREKKAHLMEVQINGGSISEKVNMAFIRLYCVKLLKWWLSSLFWILVRISLDRNHYAWSRIKLNSRFQNLCPIAHQNLLRLTSDGLCLRSQSQSKTSSQWTRTLMLLELPEVMDSRVSSAAIIIVVLRTFFNSWNDDWAPSSDW